MGLGHATNPPPGAAFDARPVAVMNWAAGFSQIATLNAARARATVRQIVSALTR
jgi:hypothetical protein